MKKRRVEAREVGNGLYFELAGRCKEMHCAVCGQLCDVDRNYRGYSSYVAAVADWPTLKDRFTCPSVEDPKHYLAFKLQQRLQEDPIGPREEQMVRDDLRDVFESLSNANRARRL
jgi:hypothetical protein